MKVLSCHNCDAPSCAARYLQKKKGPEKNPFSFSLISSFGSGQQGASKLEVMVTRAVDEEIGCLHLQNANKIYY